MDKLQQVKAKLEEMKAKYNQEHEEEEYPLHSSGYGMYWSGFFTCLKEITSLVDSIEKEPASEDLQEDKDLPVRHHNYLGISQVIHGKYKK